MSTIPHRLHIKVSERDVQRQILQYLALKRIWTIRHNTGAALIESSGKRRFVRFGTPGLADIVAFTPGGQVVWIEVKSEKGRQTEIQKEFQLKAEKHQHHYVLAKRVEDLYPLFGGVK